MRRRTSLLTTAALALAVAAQMAAPAAAPAATSGAVDHSLLAGMAARSIGPAAMSGRIAAIAASVDDPTLVYVGTASGGVWKSVNGGLTWEPVFDDQPVASIGSLALAPNNPDVVWVGSGEGNPRNSVSVGEGVFKSLDGGRTWRRAGLEKTERIHRLLLDPRNPDVAYAAAMGQLWGENPERGVFKTTDGGKTWKKVLYVDERTGAADLVMDPANPDKLIAALWDHRRQPWTFRSGGPGSGIYVTHDGGETWRRLTEDDGLPKGDLGRTGLAFAPSDPRIVYALVEARESALLRSEDGGRTWRSVNTETNVNPRPFYYADIYVDPQDPNRIYRLASSFEVSTDGGKSFRSSARAVHPDHHALWINPSNPSHLYNGNDGGVYVSHDRAATWSFAGNLPLAQFYHVRVDDAVPYNVYGGLQDNGSWKGPSTVWEQGGIRNHHWQEVGFGDGFDTVPDPRDPMRGYAMSQGGFLLRWDLRTGERKDIRPPAPDAKTDLRFNWNTGIAIDPFAPDTLYYGSQFVHKSTDRGESWTIISPDLTTNRKEWQKKETGGITQDVTGAENFTTIIALAPSPVAKGVLWAGTDDGRLHVTRNADQEGGAHWQSVEGNIPGVPDNTWIPHVTPSPHDAGTAFVVFDDHRRSNWTPYVYRTTDYGKTWKSLATKDLRGYALSIVQDPMDPDLLFLGTEFGLWVSMDAGQSWTRWKHGVPTVSVMDLAIHPREHDLVVATHGRSLFVLDDLRPLRSLTPEIQKKPVHLFDIPDAQQYRVGQGDGARFPGVGEFRGTSRPYGALLTYSLNVAGLPHPDKEKERERKEAERLKKAGEAPPPSKTEAAQPKAQEQGGQPLAQAPGEGDTGAAGSDRRGRDRGPEAEIEILDESGKVIRTFKQQATQGINRATWDLRTDAFRRPRRPSDDEPENEFRRNRGPEVLPGTYTVRVKYGKEQAEGKVRVLPDPRFQITPADREANMAAVRRAGALSESMTDAVERIQRTRADVDAITGQLRRLDDEAKRKGEAEDPARKELQTAARTLRQGLEKVEKRLWNTPDTRGIVYQDTVESKLGYVARALASSWDKPTAANLAYLDQAEERAREVFADVNRFFAEDVAAFRAKVRQSGIELLPEWKPIELSAARGGASATP